MVTPDYRRQHEKILGVPDEPDYISAGEVLICVECAAEAPPNAQGWRVYLDVENTPVTYCPECAKREFGHE